MWAGDALAARRLYYAKNRETILAANKRWRGANADKVSDQRASYREANKAAVRRGIKAWQQENPERVRLYSRNHEALAVSAEGFHTADDIAAIRRAQNDKCALCSVRLMGKGHVDHIHPLAKGGSNWPKNLQLLCVSCNTSKGARHPIEFSQSRGLLP
jgi:5-methylcytosine-specific restriction endonuclease McrA